MDKYNYEVINIGLDIKFMLREILKEQREIKKEIKRLRIDLKNGGNRND